MFDPSLARQYAIVAHGDQRYGEHPYVYHLDAVFKIAKEYKLNDTIKIAAYLHDVLEDTAVNYEDLERTFDTQIARLVEAVTNEGTKEDTYKKIKAHSTDAVVLKLCDRIANLEACEPGRDDRLINKYVNDWPSFRILQSEHDFIDLWGRAYNRIKTLSASI